jgi:Ca-activated chloride channel family protein
MMRAALLALSLGAALPASACGTALMLSMDVSNSVDAGEYRIQTDGLAAALRDPQVTEGLTLGGGAVAVMQWSGAGMQQISIPWTRVTTAAELRALAGRVETMPRAYIGANTALGEALSAAIGAFAPVRDCARLVLDVSGDGSDNAGTNPATARRLAARQGITVNALAIEGLGAAITNYYRAQVITPDGFVETARGFTDYARAIRDKMRREVSRVLF